MDKKIPQLDLYYRPTCPYCRKVLGYMEDHSINDVTMYDISSDEAALDRLVQVGGKKQVPCLFIDSKPMYESDDIIAFLAKTFDQDLPDQKSAPAACGLKH